MQAIRKVVDVDAISNIVNIPETFGKKVEMIVLPLFNEGESMSEEMMRLQQESGFIKTRTVVRTP